MKRYMVSGALLFTLAALVTACGGSDTRINPFNARLRAMLGSDIGHWDVPDMTQVLPEAYELVERGLLKDQDFSDFVFGNVIRLHAGMNPDFFKGTRVEAEARALVAEEVPRGHLG